jgi:Fic family protein
MEGNRIEEIINRLDVLRRELDSYRPISADRMNRIMQKLRLEWNFNSNSMEGNTLTKQETQKLLHYGITAKGKPLRDHIEMKGHDKALKKLEAIVHKDLKLSESLIKDFHKMILAESESLTEKNVEINPGAWKKHHNYLLSPTGERIDFAPPEQVPDLMSELINWTNNHLYQAELNRHKKKKYDLHPLVIAAVFHKRFIAIHPFGDGNGRMGRILMNLLLMQNGFMPTIVPLTSRDGYYLALNDSTAEDMSPLVEYVGENLIESMELAIEGAKGNSVEEPKDWEKELEVMRQKVTSENTKIEQTTWSLNNQRSILKKILYPLLKELVPKFQKTQETLYEDGYWVVAGKSVMEETIVSNEDELIEVLINAYEDREYAKVRVTYVFEYFNGKNQKFTTIFYLEIQFREENYSINISIGNQDIRYSIIKGIAMLTDALLKQEGTILELEMVSKKPYNKLYSLAQIDAYSDVIMKNLMQYIKKQKGE